MASLLGSKLSYESLPISEEGDKVVAPVRRWNSTTFTKITTYGVIQTLILSLYTLWLVKILGLNRCKNESMATPGTSSIADTIWSPAASVLQWRPQLLDTRVFQDSEYVGLPSDDIDKAWSKLLDLSNIAVSSSSLSKINKTSILVPDSDESDPLAWVTLGVNHELHCINRLREIIYSDHYHADWTDAERVRNRQHADHCLDYLRQTSMCHADVSVTTYWWGEGSPLPVADFETPHACADWDAISEFQRSRLFKPMEPGVLKHPLYGPAFPDGDGDKIGVTTDQSVKHPSVASGPRPGEVVLQD
ncbi:hypothetical protein F5Y19DRAFT_445614 [Xylariaceae sp. FL1651]|nr:hypothetical protein F5Y19DRAFT_445614 [Xylariaceae sp. FL1651]